MNTVLIVDDDDVLREALAESIKLAGYDYLMARHAREALMMLEKHSPALVLSDIRMDGRDGENLLSEILRRQPGMPVIMMTAYPTIENAIEVMRRGAVDYISKPFSTQTLIDKLSLYMKLEPSDGEHMPVAEDAKSQALMSMTLRVAESDVGVLITGESGTGKDVLAHYIHDHSQRREHPFVAINCAAIPEQMLEATLFGYEKGSFTGAYKSTPGKFEQAQHGTLLLDEVSEMPLALQAKLLRVLQEKEVERIGANELIQLDVRVISTSNRCLQDEIKAGRFREDLFYRLNVFPLHWLPLRERMDDIIPLANYLIRRHCRDHYPVIPTLADDAKEILLSYSWPGNARELDNVIQRALVLQTQNCIESCHLQLTPPAVQIKETGNLQENEFALIEKTLKEHQGNRQKAADTLGVSERTLRYKLSRMREEGYVI